MIIPQAVHTLLNLGLNADSAGRGNISGFFDRVKNCTSASYSSIHSQVPSSSLSISNPQSSSPPDVADKILAHAAWSTKGPRICFVSQHNVHRYSYVSPTHHLNSFENGYGNNSHEVLPSVPSTWSSLSCKQLIFQRRGRFQSARKLLGRVEHQGVSFCIWLFLFLLLLTGKVSSKEFATLPVQLSTLFLLLFSFSAPHFQFSH